MTSYSIYFPNTDLIQEVEANTWDIDNKGYLTFWTGEKDRDRNGYKNKHAVAVFNMSNILGFREI